MSRENEAQEAEQRAKKEAEEARLAVEEQAKKEAEEARKTKEAEPIVQYNRPEIYKGDFRLVLTSPGSFKKVMHFEEELNQIESLRITMSGGSVDEGAIFLVSTQKPINLIQVLNKMPMVEKVDTEGKNIVIVLKR